MFGLCWPNKPWLAAMVWWVVGATNMRVFVCVCGRKTITFWWCIWVCLRARVYLVVMRAVYLCTTHNFINGSGLWCGIADAIASTPHFRYIIRVWVLLAHERAERSRALNHHRQTVTHTRVHTHVQRVRASGALGTRMYLYVWINNRHAHCCKLSLLRRPARNDVPQGHMMSWMPRACNPIIVSTF